MSIFWLTGVIVWGSIAVLIGRIIYEWAKFVIKRQIEAKPRKETDLSFWAYYRLLFGMALYDAKRFWREGI